MSLRGLAIALAKESIFGKEEMKRCSLSGRLYWRDWVAVFWKDCGAKLSSVGCRVDW